MYLIISILLYKRHFIPKKEKEIYFSYGSMFDYPNVIFYFKNKK